MSKIWTPGQTDFERGVQEIEATDKVRQLPDGRVMSESQVTVSPEWMEQMFQGYRCARCLERQTEAFPEFCLNWWCRFPIREEQRRQLNQDFVGQQPKAQSGFDLEREFEYLDRKHHTKKPMMSVPKKLK